MRRALPTILLLLLLAAPAAAATPRPVVKSVSPLKANLGEVMTITGRYFNPGYSQNVVVFQNKAGKVAYVRAENATTDSVTVVLSERLQRLLKKRDGKPIATKFKIRVISSRRGMVGLGRLAQPAIGPDVGEDCDKDGQTNDVDTDDDSDVLPDTLEAKARTNPCGADSDGDKLLDGWEYFSAIDLNRANLPYPGKRPYPNALFADSGLDFDGDGLVAASEHTLWWLSGHGYPLSYSDGNQRTDPVSPGEEWWLDSDRDGALSDDERDFDDDGLSNVVESVSRDMEPWSGYPGISRPDYADPDSDGDGLLDGSDDQDHDDISNVDEFIKGTWMMNPCDPLNLDSRTCPRWIAVGGEPKMPQHLCLSQTIVSGLGVRWLKDVTPSEDTAACRWDFFS